MCVIKKEVEFKAKLSTDEFDRSVQDMVKKLKDVSQPIGAMQQQTAGRMQQAGLGGMSAPSMEAYQKATQGARREMDSLISEQAKGQEKLGKFITQRTESIKKLVEEQKKMTKDSREYLDIQEKIIRAQANQQSLKEQYRQRDQQLNQALDAREQMKPQGAERLMAAYKGGGLGGAATSAGRMISQNPGGFIGGLGSVAAGVGQLGLIGTDIYRNFGRAPTDTNLAYGSAVQNTLGKDTQNIYGRRTSFEMPFMQERAKAAQMAIEAGNNARKSDLSEMGFGLLRSAGLGAGAGAIGGSVIPGLGTAAGAIGGGALGLGKGLMDIAGNKRQLSLALSPFSSTMKDQYNSSIAKQMGEDYQSNYEAQKAQNPFKTAAVSEYEQNWQRNLGAQRSMGLNNEQFYGNEGYLRKGIQGGFTPEAMLEKSQGVLSAGGSTRAAEGSALLSNQMSRGMNLTNSSQILGSLSGGLGSSESTRQATIKILAEGMKIGLNESTLAEENRKFTQVVADIVSRSGAKGENDFERVSGGFGKFVGENTGAGLGAAKNAYEEYQKVSSTTTGPQGVMRAAGMMSDPALNKMSTMTKQALLQIPQEQYNEDHPVIQNAAKEAGISPKELIDKMSNNVNQGSVNRFKESDVSRDKIKAYMKSVGKDRLSDEDRKGLPQDIQEEFNKMVTTQGVQYGNTNERDAISRALGTINGTTDKGQLGRENIATDKLTRDTGKLEDKTMSAMAAESGTVLKNFNEMAPILGKAAENTAKFTDKIREMNAALSAALEQSRQTKDYGGLQKTLEQIARENANMGNQTQMGKKSK